MRTPIVPSTTVSRRLRRARQQLGLNQCQAAEAIGVSRNTYAGWERGEHEPIKSLRPALRRFEEAAEKKRRKAG